MRELDSTKALVVFSGGQDSTTCLAWAIDKWDRPNVEAVTFDYDQRHIGEIEQAAIICEKMGVVQTIIKNDLFSNFSGSALLDKAMDINAAEDELPSSFVPGRNAFFLLAAAMMAYKRKIKNIVAGVCQTDYSGYPDCRNESIRSVQTMLNLCMETDFAVYTPLMYLTKAQTFALADNLSILDMVIKYSSTCYEADKTWHAWGYGCGVCPACKLRKRGYDEFSRQKA